MVHQKSGPVIVIVGTRPEGIKMIPVYFALKKAGISTLLCSTVQHGDLLRDVFSLFNVAPDISLDIMRIDQDLFYVTHAVLQKTKELFSAVAPSLVLVQGDTTSTMAAALAAFYLQIPVGHIEAGLRTDDIYSPFPEEMNRRFIDIIATYHFAPTEYAMSQLLAHGAPAEHVFCTGNTVVDAIYLVKNLIDTDALPINKQLHARLEAAQKANQRIVLLTCHRRESFNGGIERILATVKQYMAAHPDLCCFYPYHPNPHVIQALGATHIAHEPNIFVSEPLAYQDLIYLLCHADVVLTDSGGIQEEAVSLGKHVLVLREKTERMEGVWAGLATVVGTDQEKIMNELTAWHTRPPQDAVHSAIYGDGHAAEKIVTLLQKYHLSAAPAAPVQETMHVTAATKMIKDSSMKDVCVIGLGYIGLPTAIVAAEHGFNVIGFDVDAKRVAHINAGDPVIQEPEIFERLHLALQTGRLRATATIEPADFFMIAVPTPFKEHSHTNKEADLSYVFAAAESVATVLVRGNTIILESTVPVGTTHHLAHLLEEKTGLKVGTDFFVAHCPERVLPGNIFKELRENARIIGGIDRASVEEAKKFYAQCVNGELYLTTADIAEMVKLVENSYRDVCIAFSQQVASMAYSRGIDPFKVVELANKHPRVSLLNPSCGVGGHCIAVDPWFLVETFPAHTQLLHAARLVNDGKPHEVMRMIDAALASWKTTHPTTNCTVLLLGVTYKANVDDMRESPALFIAQQLTKRTDINAIVNDPYIPKATMRTLFGDRAVSKDEGVAQADIIVYLVGHTQYKALDATQVAHKILLDFCGITHTPATASATREYLFWPTNNPSFIAQEVKETHDSKGARP